MGRMGIAALVVGVVLALGSTAQAKGGRRGGGRIKEPRYDASRDFSKHFDEEVKREREHPRDEEGVPPRHAKRGRSRASREPSSNE
jgi:hypothetical protein